MIGIIRRLFGKKIQVTQDHINRGIPGSAKSNPVSLAIQEHLDRKYGSLVNNDMTITSKKEIYTTLSFCIYTNGFNKFGFGIPTPLPKSVLNFICLFEFDRSGKPFSFYYCI